jgi:hypothetical protein
MNLSGSGSTLLAALVLGCGAASASTIVVSGVDTTRGAYDLVIRENNTDDVKLYFAGVISIEVTEGGKTFNRDSLCVDLFTTIGLGPSYDTTLLRPADVPQKNLARASWLVDNALLPAQNSSYSSELPQIDWVSSATPAERIAQGEGIQLAIWDIVNDGGNGFSSGLVQAAQAGDLGNTVGPTDAAVLTWAVFYENASVGKSNNQAFVYNNIGNGTLAQMLIGPQFFDGGPQPVPEPQTLMPMSIALIALSLGLLREIGKGQ